MMSTECFKRIIHKRKLLCRKDIELENNHLLSPSFFPPAMMSFEVIKLIFHLKSFYKRFCLLREQKTNRNRGVNTQNQLIRYLYMYV